MAAVLCTAAACRPTRYVPVETVRTEWRDRDNSELLNVVKSLTERLHEKEHQVDSLMQSYRERLVLSDKGDTLRHDREKIVYRSTGRERELEHNLSQNDSVIKALRLQLETVKADTIRVPYPVERKLTRWERAKMDLGEMALGVVVALCAAVVWLARRKKG